MYQVKIIPRAAKDLDALHGKIFDSVQDVISTLAENPRPQGCLKLTDQEGYRIRVGDYRILYEIDDSQKFILVFRIRHRRDVYR